MASVCRSSYVTLRIKDANAAAAPRRRPTLHQKNRGHSPHTHTHTHTHARACVGRLCVGTWATHTQDIDGQDKIVELLGTAIDSLLETGPERRPSANAINRRFAKFIRELIESQE